MTDRIDVAGLKVARVLFDFLENEALPDTGLDAAAFWTGFAAIVRDLGDRNRQLLAVRDTLQRRIDDYHHSRRGEAPDNYEQFLREIGYIVPEVEPFAVRTVGVDYEIAQVAGPQLVVPLSNARYALNAANARWGSLYDALYGTDAISDDGGAARGASYNKLRGQRVVDFARTLLDEIAPLAQGSHRDATGYSVEDGALTVELAGGGDPPHAPPHHQPR
jgi:malate synthase